MVVDTLDNLSKYEALNPLFKEVLAFLQNNDLNKMEEGKYPICGDDLFLNLTTAKGKAPDAAVLETHNQMIDIQIPLSTAETYGTRHVRTCRRLSIMQRKISQRYPT